MEVLHTPPVAASFTPLVEHQSRTPESFYNGPPVLRYHSDRCKVVILESDLTASPALNALRGSVLTANRNGDSVNNHETPSTAQEVEMTEEQEIIIEEVDVWVSSDKFVLYRNAVSAGVAIPYPSISLHAIQRLHLPDLPQGDELQGLYMQLANPSAEGPGEEDEEEDSINLTIVPPPVAEAASAALGSFTAGTETIALTASEMAVEEGVAENKPDETRAQALFAAVSACSNLHPDPVYHGEDDEDMGGQDATSGLLLSSGLAIPGSSDGGLPPPVNGSSGWITADNMHEYFDQDGNWIADGEPPTLPLGPGAGSVRPRDDDDQFGQEGENGTGEGNGEGNRDGSDETKWRRTG